MAAATTAAPTPRERKSERRVTFLREDMSSSLRDRRSIGNPQKTLGILLVFRIIRDALRKANFFAGLPVTVP